MANAKAILVDFASLMAIKRALGIAELDLPKLCEMLISISTAPCYGRPFVALNSPALKKHLDRAGFETEVFPPGQERDDREIIDRIARLTPDVVSEIVLVSADGGYRDHLRTKAAQGIKVYLVATRAKNPADERPLFSENSLESEFTFVELGDYKGVIAQRFYGPDEERVGRRGASQRARTRVVTLTFEVHADSPSVATIGRVHLRLASLPEVVKAALSIE